MCRVTFFFLLLAQCILHILLMSLCSFHSCRGLSEIKEALLCCYKQKVEIFLEGSPLMPAYQLLESSVCCHVHN